MKSFKFLAMLLFTALVSSAWATNKTLSGSESYEAQNGDVLTGLTSGTVTIANGAKITLSDVSISGGIVCSGTAEITLVGTNSVSGATNMAGIQVGGSGTTLTIKGNGSLTANGADNSAGIGLSSAWDVNATGGDIVIEGGNITATGNGMGAGIGTGLSFGDEANHTATIGNITIKGGTVTAIGGTNQYFPGGGIGKGGAYSYGNTVVGMVTITTGIDLVEASSISQSVTYKHGETDVTSIASDYFTINEDGNRRVIVPKDDTDYTITIADGIEHGTLTGATTAKYMEMVTITTTPDFGYRLSRLVVKDAENNDVSSTSNTFLMPKGNVTVSAVFEQGTHGTTEFEWRFLTDGPYSEVVETIYDGLTTVNLQQGWSCQIRKYAVNSYSKFFLDNNTYQANIPYSGGTGAFYESGMNTKFSLESVAPAGYYDITMTDAGNGRWNVSILKTAGQIDVVPDQTYTGSEITPEPLVIAGSLNLTKGTDYVYSYMNNTNAGTATVRATFQGDYASLGYVEKTFRIIKLLTHSDITIATIPDQTYSGSEICPAVVVNDGETTLILGTDYTVECANNVSAGTANMTITGMGDYPGSVSKTFEILKAPLTVTALNDTIVYGDDLSFAGVVYSGFVGEEDESVLNGTLAYECKYDRGGAAGKYDITPSGLTAENYDIEFVAGELTVEPKVVSIAWGEQTVFVYNGSEQIPTATAEGLLEGDDCELTVTGAAKNAGNYTATVTGLSNPNYKMRASDTKQDFEILKAPLTITARNKTIAYGDEPANDGVEYSGFVGEEGASVLGGVLTYGYNYKKGNKTGEYTITPGGLTADNYEINFVSGTLIVETKKTTFAAIQVFEDENGKRAEINGEYKGEGTVNIPKDIENVSVEFNRTFTVDKYSTIVLPFGIAAGSVEGAVFYKIDDIDVKIVGNDTIWGPVHITEVTDNIEANMPYLLQPTATKLTFKDPVTLNTSEKHPYGFTKAGVQWEFRGTYHYFDFGNDSTQLVGKSYGFVAKDQADGLKVGQFRWTSSKSYILPMRGYLVYRSVEKDENGDVNGGDSPKNAPMPQYVSQSLLAPSVSSIPEALDVEIVDKDGSTTVIGKINTRTGEIRLNSRSVDRWFDLQGRVLNGKPSVKGRYLHNGKIEIVK